MPAILLEFLGKPLRPSSFLGTNGLLVHHGQGHGRRSRRCDGCLPMYNPRRPWQGSSEANVEPSRRALVIGGSMSGLFAALALSRRGWDVEVFERVEGELAGRGAGIVAQPQLRAVFRAVGLDPDVALGVEVRWRRMLDRAGQVIGQAECPQTLTSWDRLFRMLRDAFPGERYRRGMTLEHVEQRSGGVTAHFAGGATATGEVLIGADGLRSSVRQQFLPDLAPLYAGYVAWRALIV